MDHLDRSRDPVTERHCVSHADEGVGAASPPRALTGTGEETEVVQWAHQG